MSIDDRAARTMKPDIDIETLRPQHEKGAVAIWHRIASELHLHRMTTTPAWLYDVVASSAEGKLLLSVKSQHQAAITYSGVVN